MIARRRAALAMFAVIALASLTACLPPVEQVEPTQSGAWPGGNVAATVSPGEAGVYNQTARWTPCGKLECATIQVPLDWTNPDGPTINLALNRSKARKPDERLGSLLINPGGPGGSGLTFTSNFLSFAGAPLLDRYDIVGFDPRGVGESTPINCGNTDQLNAYFTTQEDVERAQDVTRMQGVNNDFAQRCLELTGKLIENVDTVSAARDMDVIRAVVGDKKLHFFGFSYGSQLGATYATLYPDNVGRLVLDGAVDFLLSPEEMNLGQAAGFEKALDAYIADCITQTSCPLPRDPVLAKRAIRDLITEAQDKGLPTGGAPLNGTMIVYGIALTLYNEDYWRYLSTAFDEAINVGTGRAFLQLADYYLDRDNTTGKYLSNSMEAFTAISCLDEPPQDPSTIDQIRDFRKKAEEASPTFGWWFAAGVGCDGWPFHAHQIVTDLTPATGAGPMIIVGTTGDPATPLKWARSLADQLPNAALLIYDGQGHTAYGRSNSCILDTVDAYFVDGTMPSSGKTC